MKLVTVSLFGELVAVVAVVSSVVSNGVGNISSASAKKAEQLAKVQRDTEVQRNFRHITCAVAQHLVNATVFVRHISKKGFEHIHFNEAVSATVLSRKGGVNLA